MDPQTYPLMTVALAAFLNASPSAAVPSNIDSFAAANRALVGREATILLSNCRVIDEAKHVVLAAKTTRWRKGRRAFSAPTAEILLVASEPKRKGSAAAGAAVGLGVGLRRAAHAGKGEDLGGLFGAFHTVGSSAVLGGVLGATVFAKPGAVVYEAPAAQNSACDLSPYVDDGQVPFVVQLRDVDGEMEAGCSEVGAPLRSRY